MTAKRFATVLQKMLLPLPVCKKKDERLHTSRGKNLLKHDDRRLKSRASWLQRAVISMQIYANCVYNSVNKL